MSERSFRIKWADNATEAARRHEMTVKAPDALAAIKTVRKWHGRRAPLPVDAVVVHVELVR